MRLSDYGRYISNEDAFRGTEEIDEPEVSEEYSYTIECDQDPQHPREDCDTLGKMMCFHRRYNLGDKHDLSIPEVFRIEADEKNYISLPLYLLDHSGLRMRTRDFTDCDPQEWDSGRVGIIYVQRHEVYAEYGVRRITKATRKLVLDVLQAEVDSYDQYLSGSVYGFVIKNDAGEVVDSLWGIYGDYAEVGAMARERIAELKEE